MLVAGVAQREGWADLARPPAAFAPRTIDEAAAVERYAAAAAAREPRPRDPRRRARIATVVATALTLGVCWWVSPTRTAIAVLAVGAIAMFAMARRRRRRPVA
jgi:hypothetical protein